jgi:hypothetical protein
MQNLGLSGVARRDDRAQRSDQCRNHDYKAGNVGCNA